MPPLKSCGLTPKGEWTWTRLAAFNFQKWINEAQAFAQAPGRANKMVFEDSGMMVTVVGGPETAQPNYHDDPVEEFYLINSRATCS